MGALPEAIGVAGNRSPLKRETEFPPSLILSAVKGTAGTYRGAVDFPAKTPLDVAFTFLFRVEGLWQKEPNNLGIPHVVMLDSSRAMQSVFLAYDSAYARLAGQTKLGLAVDGYSAASAFATSARQSSAARQYDYFNAVGLLGSGRTAEAVMAYNSFCSASPAGQLSREEYDMFPVYHARALSRIGKRTDAVAALRAVPTSAGGASYQANVQLALGRLLHENGNRAEARSIYSDIQKRSGVSAEVKDQSAYALASSYARESTRDSLERGKKMLRTFIATTQNPTFKRTALLALADAEERSKSKAGLKSTLKLASPLGTGEQRLSVKMQLLDLQFSEGDFAGTHSMCKWILASGDARRHLPHLLYLDAVSLKRMGKDAESAGQLKRLYAEFPGNAYSAYAAAVIIVPGQTHTPADSISKGAVHQ
jgi:tetratricopeptide (TPR) repeat protein